MKCARGIIVAARSPANLDRSVGVTWPRTRAYNNTRIIGTGLFCLCVCVWACVLFVYCSTCRPGRNLTLTRDVCAGRSGSRAERIARTGRPNDTNVGDAVIKTSFHNVAGQWRAVVVFSEGLNLFPKRNKYAVRPQSMSHACKCRAGTRRQMKTIHAIHTLLLVL